MQVDTICCTASLATVVTHEIIASIYLGIQDSWYEDKAMPQQTEANATSNGSAHTSEQSESVCPMPASPPAASNKYTPKNILVTGGAGFIASHVVILLVERYPQYKIVNFDRLDYCSCLENLDSVKGRPNYKVRKKR